jgi:4-amino-4-deoxy-L-arabinose transferase-like glycosyltransferase
MKKKDKHKKNTGAIKQSKSRIPWKIILIVIATVLLIFLFDPKTFLGGDNAHYMSCAQSILRGSYRVEAYIGSPPEIAVPPGYPFILAILRALFGRTFVPAKIFSLGCYVIALWLWWKLFTRAGIKKRTSLAFLAFGVLNPIISEYSHWEITEAPFMVISSAAILFFFIALEKDNNVNWLITVCLAAGAFYIRAAGITLSLAIIVALLLHKKWRTAIGFFAGVGILILPWVIYIIAMRGQVGAGMYLPQFLSEADTGEILTVGSFLDKGLRNFERYAFVNLPSLFFPIAEQAFFRHMMLGYLVGGILLILLIGGIIYTVRSPLILYGIYTVLYVLVLLAYSEQAAIVRYLVVVFPFIAILFTKGITKLCSRLGVKQVSYCPFVMSIIFVILALPVYISAVNKNVPLLSAYLKGNHYAGYSINHVRFIEANQWIEEHGVTSAGVISRKPRLTWWFSGHPARNYLFNRDPQRVKADIDSSGARYVLVDRISSTTPRFLIPALQIAHEQFKILFVTRRPDTYVLEVMR